MDKMNVIKHITAQYEVDFPDVQQRYNLTYAQTKSVFDELVKEGILVFKSGVTYGVTHRGGEYERERGDNAERIKALWACVRSGEASFTAIRRWSDLSYTEASDAMRWMEKCGYITPMPERRLLFTREEFISKYGDPDEEVPLFSKDELKLCEGAIPDSYLFDDAEEDEEMDVNMIKKLLADCVLSGLDDAEDGNFYFKPDAKSSFCVKFVADDDGVVLTDCGKTLIDHEVTQCRARNVVKRYRFLNLEGGEIVARIKEPTKVFTALMNLYCAADAIKRLK